MFLRETGARKTCSFVSSVEFLRRKGLKHLSEAYSRQVVRSANSRNLSWVVKICASVRPALGDPMVVFDRELSVSVFWAQRAWISRTWREVIWDFIKFRAVHARWWKQLILKIGTRTFFSLFESAWRWQDSRVCSNCLFASIRVKWALCRYKYEMSDRFPGSLKIVSGLALFFLHSFGCFCNLALNFWISRGVREWFQEVSEWFSLRFIPSRVFFLGEH